VDREALEQALIGIEPQARKAEKVDRAAVVVPVGRLSALMQKLRQDKRFDFDMLVDHTAIDRLPEGRFDLVYNLYSTRYGLSLLVICSVPRNEPVVPTMEGIWKAAHWQEREVFDLFGVLYDGHTDLRRIFLDDDWKGHPLRKDYKDPDMLEFN